MIAERNLNLNLIKKNGDKALEDDLRLPNLSGIGLREFKKKGHMTVL